MQASDRCILRALIAACLIVLPGCAGILSPEPPAVFVEKNEDSRFSLNDLHTLKLKYDNALWGADKSIPLANEARNEMLWSIISNVDYSYYYFESRFASGRAGIKTVSDMAQLGMSAAATALGGSAILSAATTALAGSELSADKNFLNETATANLFIQMDALRAKQLAVIQQKMLLDSTSYSFEEAYRDALAYFAAGTIPAAEAGIAEAAGVEKNQADVEADAATQARIIATLSTTTKEMIITKGTLRQAIADAMKQGDQGEAKMVAVLEARKIVPKSSLADVAVQLQDELRNCLTAQQIITISSQFKDANLIP
jgi:hypothetical protein